jgi:NADH-quinone oxidoreductase subunit B
VEAVEEVWLEVAGTPVALHVLELGLACCGVEVREARRAAANAGSLAASADELVGQTAGSARALVEGAGTSSDVARIAEPAPGDRRPVDDATGAPSLHVLVVAGTVTVQLAPVVLAAWAEVPEPRAVLAFGACATTGGPYWDSYAVLPGAHEVVDVDAWVAGCPPRPADLLAGLEEVVRGRA